MTYREYRLRLYAPRREMCRHLITQALMYSEPAGGIAIDDGAGNGVASLLMAIQLGTTGCVLCTEPDHSLYEMLQNNLALNPQLARCIRLHDMELFPQELERLLKLQTESIRPLRVVRLNCPGKAAQRLRLIEPLVRRFKPKIFICLQRDSSDWTDIPEMFCELFPNYSLQIHSHNVTANSVMLYASADSKYPVLPAFMHKPEHILINQDEVAEHRFQTEDYLYSLQQNILELSNLYLKANK